MTSDSQYLIRSVKIEGATDSVSKSAVEARTFSGMEKGETRDRSGRWSRNCRLVTREIGQQTKASEACRKRLKKRRCGQHAGCG
jgi:hypothetical protein